MFITPLGCCDKCE